ncbi:hypothetical protein [Desulfocurvus sp. DL9XJH121]
MSITSIGYNTNLDVLAVKTDSKETEWKESASQASNKWIDSVSLSSLSDKLARLVQESGSGDIVADMTEDLQKLQAGFVDALTDRLGEQGVDITQSFLLTTDDEGNIVVDGEHPDKEAIEEILNSDKTLKAAYETIAEQAELLGNVKGNTRYQSLNKAMSAYQDQYKSLQSMSLVFLMDMENQSMTSGMGLAGYL